MNIPKFPTYEVTVRLHCQAVTPAAAVGFIRDTLARAREGDPAFDVDTITIPDETPPTPTAGNRDDTLPRSLHYKPDLIESSARSQFACAECGTRTAHEYVVTTLDLDDPKGTTTEVCRACDDFLRDKS